MSRANIGKASPGAEWAIRDKVGILVHASAPIFLIRVLFLLVFAFLTIFRFGRVATLRCRLDNVVVGIGAANLTEEADEGTSLFRCEALKRLLEQVYLLLAESNAGRIEKHLIAQQVLDVADGGHFNRLCIIGFRRRLYEKWIGLLDECFQVLSLLDIGACVVDF